MTGHILMGFPQAGRRWVDTRFRSGHVMATRNFARGSASVRAEVFGTTRLGSLLGRAQPEHG